MRLLQSENATYEVESAALQRRMDRMENQDLRVKAGKQLRRSEVERYGLQDPGDLVDLQERVAAQEQQNVELLRRLKAAQRAMKTRDVNSRNNMLVSEEHERQAQLLALLKE
jgi:hypothetical protein